MPQRTEQIQEPVVVWRIVDGKPGHESQTAGLVQSLARLTPVKHFDVPAMGRFGAILSWLTGRFLPGKVLPVPDLILGAGHRTHWTMLAARRAWGGQAVVLMKPSLPLKWFDFCLIPQHDGVALASNVAMTRGVLNTIEPSATAEDGRGLFLVGGPSSHHAWDESAMVAQILQIVQANRDVFWTLTTSRRTPDATVSALKALSEPNLEVVPYAETERGWVGERLQECAHAWVSEDSVSMVYEALTAGARVGLLSVPAKERLSRVQAGVEALVAEGYVTRLEDAAALAPPAASTDKPMLFCEADRCAELVLKLVCGD